MQCYQIILALEYTKQKHQEPLILMVALRLVTKGGVMIVKAVDCRNCAEDDINASLQSSCFRNINSNNVVRIS